MANINRYTHHVLALLSALLYYFITYYLERPESTWLLSAYFVLFAAYFFLVKTAKREQVLFYIVLAVLFRMLLLMAFPNLSDDIYRFVWDGKLISQGINPFSHLPSAIVADGNLPEGLNLELYKNLNSPDYFTIYPPFAQFIYWLSATLSPSSVWGCAIVMRLLIILAEIVSIKYLLKLAKHFKVSEKNVLWYALNPLVILELTANLHYEAFMICFLLIATYLLVQRKFKWAGFFMAMAISVKLLPLILLPLFLRRVPVKQLIKFYGSTAFFSILFFLPLLGSSLFNGMSNSLSLYFQKFEFNASVYYLIRAIGFEVNGYNMINTIGPYLALTTFALIIIYSVLSYRKKLPQTIIWVFMIYLMLATTVHPWYITTLLVFSVLTKFRFGLLWSFLIFFTYQGYSAGGFQENLWITATEYIVLIVYVAYEIFKNYKEKQRLEAA